MPCIRRELPAAGPVGALIVYKKIQLRIALIVDEKFINSIIKFRAKSLVKSDF